MRLSNRRPSPALIVACIALFVALTGTSIAAVSQLVPRSSVGTAQLKNNAVTSAKVKNRTLARADFRPGVLLRGPAGPAGAAGPAGPAGPAGTGATVAFASVTGPNATSTSSTSYVELPTASAAITVPAGAAATLFISFSAESACSGAAGYCTARVVLDGNEVTPVAGDDFAFDSTDGGSEGTGSWESHAIQRVATGVAAGAHTVTVQYAVTNAAATLRLDDWGFTVLALRQ